MSGLVLTAEAKATMIANLELELNARKEKLRAMCEAQCASLRSRLERRVNRIPASKRQLSLAEFLAPTHPVTAPAKAAPSRVAASKTTTAKKAAAAAPAPTTAAAPPQATRKARAAPAASRAPALKETSKPVPPPKSAPKPAATKTTAVKQTTTRAKKRSSDEMSSEDKENTGELEVPKKRVRTATAKAPAAPAAKAAPATRATRAASRQKANPAQVLSPKNSNPRQKPAAKPATRPR